MNRRGFLRRLIAAPALLECLGRAADAAEGADEGLEREVDAVLKEHFVIDTAASDTFFRYPKLPPPSFHPESVRRLIGGAILGIGQLSGQVPTFLPEDSLLRQSRLATPHLGFKPLRSGPATVEHILGEFEATRRAVEAHPGRSAIATSAGEMESFHQAGKLCLVLGLDTGDEIDSNFDVLAAYYRLGLRKLAMTHEVAPPWAESDTGDAPSGLKPFGREVVAACNRMGIMVDVSHSSDRTFWGVIESSKRPIIATHSGARRVAAVARNLDDEMIKAVAKNGGMIGVGGILNQKSVERANSSGHYNDAVLAALWMEQKYPDPEAFAAAWYDPAAQEEARKALGMAYFPAVGVVLTDPESTLAHLDHITGLIGFDHVGFGTDLVTGWAPLYPNMIRGIARGLIQRNYDEDKMAKILGRNFLRVFRDNEGRGA